MVERVVITLGRHTGPAVNRCIYIVDDDAPVRESLTHLLQHRSQHAVQAFPSGAAFLQVLDRLKPGIVLLDYQMPPPDGLDVLAEMQRRGAHFPVVMVTAHGDLRVVVQAMRGGACDYLEKPYSLEELRLVIAGAFGLLEDDTAARERRRLARGRIDALSPLQVRLLQMVLGGASMAETAQALNVGERALRIERERTLETLGVASLSGALRLALTAGMPIEAVHGPR